MSKREDFKELYRLVRRDEFDPSKKKHAALAKSIGADAVHLAEVAVSRGVRQHNPDFRATFDSLAEPLIPYYRQSLPVEQYDLACAHRREKPSYGWGSDGYAHDNSETVKAIRGWIQQQHKWRMNFLRQPCVLDNLPH